MTVSKLIKANGTQVHIYPADGVAFNRDEIVVFIGDGCVDVESVPVQYKAEPLQLMIKDSQGSLNIQRPNLIATKMYLKGRYRDITDKQIEQEFETKSFKLPALIRGDVVICDPRLFNNDC